MWNLKSTTGILETLSKLVTGAWQKAHTWAGELQWSQAWISLLARTCRGIQLFIQLICTASGNISPKTCIYSSKALDNTIFSTTNTPYCFLNRPALQDWRGEQSEYPTQSLGYSSKRPEMQAWNTSGYGGHLVFGQVVLLFMGTSTSFLSFSFKPSQPHFTLGRCARVWDGSYSELLVLHFSIQPVTLNCLHWAIQGMNTTSLSTCPGVFSSHKEVTPGMIWNMAVDFNGSPTRNACSESGLGAFFSLSMGSHTTPVEKVEEYLL